MALALGAATAFAAAPASAFCRSTTCSGDCPRDENGCKITGAPLAWPGICVGFSIQRDGTVNLPMAKVRPAIEAGFVAWSDLDCGAGTASLAFSELDDVTCHRAEYAEDGPNANIILFQDTRWSYKGADNTLAKTTVTFDTDSGEILDADMEINHAYNEYTVDDDHVVYDLQSIVAHEVGHFIGLDHSADPDATMFAGYDEGSTTIRTLEADDIAAVCAVYPPDRGGDCEPEPKNGLADECVTEGAGGGAGEGSGCGIAAGAPRGSLIALGLFCLGLVRGPRSRRVGARWGPSRRS